MTKLIVSKHTRKFLPEKLAINSWEDLQPFFKELQERKLDSPETFEKFLQDISELKAVTSEDFAWRYIRMSCDNEKQEYKEAYEFFLEKISPKIAPIWNSLNKKIVECPFVSELAGEKYEVMLRKIRKNIEIFREENIPLATEEEKKSAEFGSIASKMMATIQNEEYTIQKAAQFMKDQDASLREEAFRGIWGRRKEDSKKLDTLLTDLIKLRTKIARNADFSNYRDYAFAMRGRFDYTPQDCFTFHQSIKEVIVPLLTEFLRARKKELGVTTLRPWDLEFDTSNKPPLKPFETGDELFKKMVACFRRLRPSFGEMLEQLRLLGHIDLDSRKGKTPGGYNYPLLETGVPFVFMNAAGSQGDVETLAHEGGHAIHSILTHNLELNAFKQTPPEIAELASMSMEFMTMDTWDEFYKKPEDLKRAKKEMLERSLFALAWIAVIDKFQHWIYENPKHTLEERKKQWLTIFREFTSDEVDWSGLEEYEGIIWQKQIHLFDYPFYYIEYGFCQLGAIAMWKNFAQDQEQALDQYTAALKLGYTKTIPKVYATAGVSFDFSKEYIQSLADFVRDEYKKI